MKNKILNDNELIEIFNRMEKNYNGIYDDKIKIDDVYKDKEDGNRECIKRTITINTNISNIKSKENKILIDCLKQFLEKEFFKYGLKIKNNISKYGNYQFIINI